VGEVKDINLIFHAQEQKTKIQVVCWIKNKVMIPRDSTVWVNTLGLLGEKYVEIMPGKDYSNCLLADQDLIGVDPIPMNVVLDLAQNIANNVNESIVKIKNKEGTIGKLLYDDKIYNELDALVTDIRKHPWKLFFKTK
jgi:ABC-type transporter Mla subunit MlaD